MNDYTHCIDRGDKVSYCGESLCMTWCFINLEHAENSLKKENRNIPCKKCLKIARATAPIKSEE